MKCKYCGEEFQQNARGKKKAYCNKKECIQKARNEANRKWYASKMKILNGTKNRIIEQGKEKKVIYSSTDRINNITMNEDFSDIIEISREIGAIKFKINEMIKKLNNQQSFFDKEDDKFLHDIEDLTKKDEVYEEDIISVVMKHINNRPNRRIIKDKQEMLQHLTQSIMSNPNQYVVEFIKNRNNRKYNPDKKVNK